VVTCKFWILSDVMKTLLTKYRVKHVIFTFEEYSKPSDNNVSIWYHFRRE